MEASARGCSFGPMKRDRLFVRRVLHVFATAGAVAQLVLGRAIFFAVAIAIGMVSSWFAIQRGLPFNTEKVGPWLAWHYAGNAAEEPYTRARFASSGGLPLSGDRITRLEARFDDDGRRLHSSCVYEMTGQMIDARWWTIGVFDSGGNLIPNAAQRYGLNNATTTLNPDGRFTIVLARDARSGNWLPTGAAGRLIVVLEVQEPSIDAAEEGAILRQVQPPQIRRVSC